MLKPGFLLIVMLLTVVAAGFDQDNVNLKVGDTVYVNAFYGGCVKATVTQIDPKYSVRVLEGTYKDRNTFYSADRIKECPQSPANNAQPINAPVPNNPATPNTGNTKVGDRVDVYLSDNREAKNRGTVVEVDGSRYKVHYDGCSQQYDVWESAALVRPAATISVDSAEIKFLNGKWSMTTVGLSSSAIAWGKSPGIQINSDGTYVWYQDGGRPPVKGRWQTHARIDGARVGTETENGILISDAKGSVWKMYRRKSSLDNDDHVTIRLMCSGETQMGSRTR